MNLEDIIYIVVTIVIMVVSLLSKSKKKAKPIVENHEEKEYNLNEFEKLLERRQEYIQKEENEADVEDNTKSTIELGKAVKSLYKEKKEKHESTSKLIELEEDEDENSKDYIPEDGFDVKSAIIYSSILERKKFRH